MDKKQITETLIETPETKPLVKDNRPLGILLINTSAVFNCLRSLTFKTLGRSGVTIVEYTLFRSIFNIICTTLIMNRKGISPNQPFTST